MTDIKKKLNLAKATVRLNQNLQPVNLIEEFRTRGVVFTGSDNSI